MNIETSTEISEFAAAFCAAQAVMGVALKDSNNPHFKSKYADLTSVWAAAASALKEHGLSVMQFPGACEGGQLHMTTQIMHKSGQWMRSSMSIPLAKNDAQAYGSAVTYARRYAMSAALGIVQDDDDGNAASAPAPAPEKISKDQAAELMALIEATGTEITSFCKYYKTDAVAHLPASKFDHALKALKAKLTTEQAA